MRFIYFKMVMVLCLFIAVNAQADSLRVMSVYDFIQQVISNHPVARQAQLLTEQARMNLRVSRGAMDPKYNMLYYEKHLDGVNYYNVFENELKIPIWIGDFKAGFENNGGVNLNGENFTPPNGLSKAGITVPIGQGLLIDERRTQLLQAKIMINMSEAEKISIINKLLLQGVKDYWQWTYYYYRWQAYVQAEALADFRLDAVKERVWAGDLAAIDTLEAKMQLNQLAAQRMQAELEYKNATLFLSGYLWSEEELPLEIPSNMIPSMEGSEIKTMTSSSLDSLYNLAKENHPDLKKELYKIDMIALEKKLYADKLKPQISFDYFVIQKGFWVDPTTWSGNYLSNNYKVGVTVSQPLFLRKERGQLAVAKIKLQQARLGFQQLNRDVLNKVESYYNQYMFLEDQMNVQTELLDFSKTLRDAETDRFNNGESSMFLINTRDQYVLQQQIKWYELKSKYASNKFELQWAAGKML